MNDPLFLSLDEVLQLHAEAIEQFGGDPGVRDLNLIKSAIAEPQQTFGGTDLNPDLASMAACYLFALVKNHGFVDGNKRVGARAAYLFLALNGNEIDFPVDETEALVLGIAQGIVTKQQTTQFIANLLRGR